MLDDFDRARKPRSRAGSFDGQKPSTQLWDGAETGRSLKKRKGLVFEDIDLLGGTTNSKPRADSPDSTKRTRNSNFGDIDDRPKK